MLFLHPMLNKVAQLPYIHELDIVNMSVLLPFNHNARRDAFIAHSLRVRLVVLASSIDFVSNL